ncbi:hypothetical protein EDB83DRAFT_2310870 [Lactarius deliciosus]|nr:hypothetical protein EDB83DRAFT_2310870 [Lactarius deliciosus]
MGPYPFFFLAGWSGATLPWSDYGAWEILRWFTVSDMTLPQAEAELSSHLRNHYKYEDWSLAFDAVMKAKGDTVEAQKAVQQMSVVCDWLKLTIWIPAAQPPQLVATEKELMAAVGGFWRTSNC